MRDYPWVIGSDGQPPEIVPTPDEWRELKRMHRQRVDADREKALRGKLRDDAKT